MISIIQRRFSQLLKKKDQASKAVSDFEKSFYVPPYFNEKDWKEVKNQIQESPFGILISKQDSDNENVCFTQIPVAFMEDKKLVFHLAKTNNHNDHLDNQIVNIIFQGPHAYISPFYYKSEGQVPTWDFISIFLKGKSQRVLDQDRQISIMNCLISNFDKLGWKLDIENSVQKQKFMQMIYFYEVDIEQFKAQYKLSQNKSQEDQISIIQNLQKNNDLSELILAREIELNSQGIKKSQQPKHNPN